MRLAKTARTGVIVAFVAAFLVACSDDGDAKDDATPGSPEAGPTRVVIEGETPIGGPPAIGVTPTQGVNPGSPPQPAPPIVTSEPPTTTASSGSAAVEMGIGTYCWGNVCADKIGVVTRGSLSIASGDEVVVAAPPGVVLESVHVTAFPAADPLALDTGEMAWVPDFTASQSLDAVTAAGEVRVSATLAAGRYVLVVGMFFATGDVQYGVVLDVR